MEFRTCEKQKKILEMAHKWDSDSRVVAYRKKITYDDVLDTIFELFPTCDTDDAEWILYSLAVLKVNKPDNIVYEADKLFHRLTKSDS